MKHEMLASHAVVAELQGEVNNLKDRVTKLEEENMRYQSIIHNLVVSLAKPSVLIAPNTASA